MRHLPVACPRCNHQQIIKIRDLDAQHECGECRTSFYIDSAGACIRGRRPQSVSRVQPSHLTQSRDVAKDPFEVLSRVPRWLLVCLTTFVLILGTWFVAQSIGSNPRSIPEPLPERATFAVEAFARNDLPTLLEMTDPASSSEIHKWFDMKRNPSAGYWRLGPPLVTTSILFKKESNHAAATVSVLQFPSPSESSKENSPENAPRLDLILFWKLGQNQLWFIDGDSTLRAATRVR